MSLSIGARAWYAYHCLPRTRGEVAAPTDLEARHGLPRGALGKLFNGKLREPRADMLNRMAKALNVSPAWLSMGTGPWPSPTGHVPDRVVKWDGPKTQLKAPIYEKVGRPTDGIEGNVVAAAPTGGRPTDTLNEARRAARQIANVLGTTEAMVWPDFLRPLDKYEGGELDFDGMVREVSKITRQRLALEAEDQRAGDAMRDAPGPDSGDGPETPNKHHGLSFKNSAAGSTFDLSSVPPPGEEPAAPAGGIGGSEVSGALGKRSGARKRAR